MSGPLCKTRYSTAGHAAIVAGLLALGTSAGVVVADQATTDQQLTLSARYALQQDSTFKKLNLGIRVRQGVATVSGPVPSTAVADQAVALLRKVSGVHDVLNETFVAPANEPLSKSMPHPVTAGRAPAPNVTPAPALAPTIPNTAPPAQAQPPVSPAPTIGGQAPTPLAPVATPVPRESLTEQIERKRQSERGFENIRYVVRGSEVQLSGTARAEDMVAFGLMVKALPGVTKVLMPKQ